MGNLPWLLDPTVCRSCRCFLLLIVDRDIGDISRALSRTSNLPGRGLCANQTTVFLQQFAHIRLPQRHGNPIHTSLNPRSKIVCLERILSAKLAGSFGDCGCQSQLLDNRRRDTWASTYSPAAGCQPEPVFGSG